MVSPKTSNINIVSIHYGHNATVGLTRNGLVICLISEERISRIKNATGFPFRAYKYLLESHLDNDPDQISLLVINDELLWGYDYLKNYGFEPHYFNDYYWKSRTNSIPNEIKKNPVVFYKKALNENNKLVQQSQSNPKRYQEALEKISKLTGVSSSKVKLLHHHKAHAYSCLFNLESSKKHLIFTLDGEGDNICATVNLWENNQLREIAKTHKFQSLGYLYREVTAFLGMKPDEHEFKVMGLAPYASAEHSNRVYQKLKDLIWLDEQLNFQTKIPMPFSNYHLLEILVYERFDTIAGGLQKLTEDLICQWVSGWIRKEGIHSIAVSGGVFMNVKACQKIAALGEVDNLFVMPSSGDESLVLGGCYWGSQLLNVKEINPLKSLYLGREFDNSYIDKYISEANLATEFQVTQLNDENMAHEAAQLLAKGEILARCVGREEWGARALGNRSIIANAHNPETIRQINQKIKSRDFWMPFTPSILAEDLDQYITNPKNIFAPYMCITFDSTEKAKIDIPAALHPYDFTVRPQAVIQEWNPSYHQLIKQFKNLTGISGILNTSFNLHGQPNVSSPEDAIYTLRNSGLNYLILGNFLINKNI